MGSILALLSAASSLAPLVSSTAKAIAAYVEPGSPATARVADALVAELGAAETVGEALTPALPVISSALQGQQVNDEGLAALEAAKANLDRLAGAEEQRILDAKE